MVKEKKYCFVFKYHLDMFILLPPSRKFKKNSELIFYLKNSFYFFIKFFDFFIKKILTVEISLYIIIRYNAYTFLFPF